MTTALIADDEPALAEHLARMLAECWPGLVIQAHARNGKEAIAAAQETPPDIAFLDIRMPGMTGLEAAKLMPEQTRVVFVTAYDQYAIDAFDAAAADYLLKPVARDRLQATVERLKGQDSVPAEALKTLIDTLTAPAPSHLQWLRVGHGDTTRLINVDDVAYFQADHKYTNVVTAAETHVLRTAISTLETELDPEQFWRVHRSTIVNVRSIETAKRDLRGRYVLKLRGRKETVRTSQAYGHLFKQM